MIVILNCFWKKKKNLQVAANDFSPQPSIPKQLVFSIFERSPEIRNLILRHLVSSCITESMCVCVCLMECYCSLMSLSSTGAVLY